MVRTTIQRSSHAVVTRGFSLIELIVVTGVLTVITSLILANNAKFGGAITLRNLAYDIALSVRESQTYGISVRKFGTGAGQFGAGYGMHFRTSSPASYLLYADAVNANGLYDGAGELVESVTISRGFVISDLCFTSAGGSSETCGAQKIDIIFKRPEPDAQIRVNDSSVLNQRARIVVASPRGDQASIIIEATGQISVPPSYAAN